MGISNANKELSASRIDCGGSFKIKLSLTAEPNIVTNPTDIVLILDRSRSMAGSPLANLKKGAETFIDILDEATDGAQDGQLGHGSRIGIVSFADTATKDTPLTATVSTLKQAVHALTSGGSTNHADAFTKALELFDPASANAKVMVLFTDGRTTAGGNASPIAAAAKAQGVVIYCIGLSGNGGIDEQALNDWSSDPDSAYVAITPDDEELENLFSDLAANITKPGATQIAVHDRVDACFKIISVDEPTKGTANQVDATSVQWKIDALGVKKSEGATLEFTVQHVGPCTGTIEVNDAITYSDREGNAVEFPSPEIEVECSVVDCSEHCPEPIEFPVDGCEDTVEFDAGEIGLDSLGRIVVLNVTLKDVCPHKRVALAIILSEVDQHGVEHRRGLKTLTIPAHTRATCKDVTVCGVKFVLPEDLDVSGSPDSICNRRKCRVRFIAHYIDHGFVCKKAEMTAHDMEHA